VKKMPKKKIKWEIVYYLGVDGVMHPTKQIKLERKREK